MYTKTKRMSKLKDRVSSMNIFVPIYWETFLPLLYILSPTIIPIFFIHPSLVLNNSQLNI